MEIQIIIQNIINLREVGDSGGNIQEANERQYDFMNIFKQKIEQYILVKMGVL